MSTDAIPTTTAPPLEEPPSPTTLWSVSTAIMVVLLMIIALLSLFFGASFLTDLQRIKEDWPNQRCRPLIMPLAGLFGHNAKENFDFCMGKVFTAHSQPYLGSITSLFGSMSRIMGSVFDSMNSLRTTIATLGGGINVLLQEFTERISTFFFRLRLSSIHLKSLFMRMYATLFSVMYMGLSGITGMTSFTNTTLFSFLDTFCFPEETRLEVKGKGSLSIKDIQIGDILLPTQSVVTATFQFHSKGQPMVQLGSIQVSTNHYVLFQGKAIKAIHHPDAIPLGPWMSDKPLYCLNTSDHHMPVGGYVFMDYDETPEADQETMNALDNQVNGTRHERMYPFTESGMTMDPSTRIRTQRGILPAKEVCIGDRLENGGEVVGRLIKNTSEICTLASGHRLSASTMVWRPDLREWKRVGLDHPIQTTESPVQWYSFVVTPHSQIPLGDGTVIRDYMEVCSPDSERYYANHLEREQKIA